MDAGKAAQLGILAVCAMTTAFIITILSLWAIGVLMRLDSGWMFIYALPGFVLFDIIFCIMYSRERKRSDSKAR